jgi:type IV pilus assembly protein PilM
MSRSIVGVDIGTSSLRAVEVAGATKARPTIVRYHEVPLPKGAAYAGEVAEPHTVAAAFKQLWSAGGFRSRDIVLGIGNQKVLARDVVVPKASLKQIRESLPFLVQDLLPVPVADAVLDFYPVAEVDNEGPALAGLLVAATKEAVLGNIAAARMAGLTPVHVDLIPFALTRLHLVQDVTRGTVALVNVGASTTSIVIIADGVPVFVRMVPAGGDALTAAVGEALGVTPEVAEQAKRGLGLGLPSVAPELQPALNVVYSVSHDLSTSVRNTLNYFTSARAGRGIDRIVLSGGGAQLSGFADALSEFTRLPVDSNEPFAGFTVAKGAGKAGTATSESIAVALGLAIGTAA